jgi:hypothetical protein
MVTRNSPVKFLWKKLPHSCTAAAEYWALVVPYNGGILESRYGELPTVLGELRVRWRRLVVRLAQAGWRPLQGKKAGYAYNCPPCSVQSVPYMQPCKLRRCPFCHGRKAADVFIQCQKLLEANPDATFVSWRHISGRSYPNYPLFLAADGGLPPVFAEQHAAETAWRKAFPTKYLEGAYGGRMHMTMTPCAGEESQVDGSTNWWSTVHGCIACGPPDWEPKETPYRKAYVCRKPTVWQLARMVGMAMPYDAQWLNADPAILVEYLHFLGRHHDGSPFGNMKVRTA